MRGECAVYSKIARSLWSSTIDVGNEIVPDGISTYIEC